MSDDTPLNSASRTSVRKQKKAATFRAQEHVARLQRLLENDDYLLEGWDFLAWCGVFHASDVADTNALCLAEGRRRAGLRFLVEHEAARPDALARMRVAHLNRKDV